MYYEGLNSRTLFRKHQLSPTEEVTWYADSLETASLPSPVRGRQIMDKYSYRNTVSKVKNHSNGFLIGTLVIKGLHFTFVYKITYCVISRCYIVAGRAE